MATHTRGIEMTEAALEEKSKLQRHFGRFDMLFFLICTLVGLDTIGSVASHGAQAFTWLIFLGVFFFVPYALVISELGSAFPDEGGPYMWTRLAFGRFVGAINTIVYWVANPVWVGGTLAILAMTTFSAFFTDISGNDVVKYLFCLAFIWFTVASAIISFKHGKWIPTVGAMCRIVVLGFFTLTVIIYGFKHGLHGFGAGKFSPTYASFAALVPVLFFNYVGFELPSAAGEEMKDPEHDVPFAVLRSAIGTVILYGGPIIAILLVLPVSQITGLSGFLDAIKSVFTVYGGHVTTSGVVLTGAGKGLGYIMAIAFIIALLTSGSTWIMGSDRTQAVAAFDGAGPRVLGIFSRRFGTPIVVNILSGIVSTLVMILAFTLTSGNANKYFTVVLGLAISTTTISYLGIFPAVIKLRYSFPDLRRPYRIPFGNAGAWVCGVLTSLWAAYATVVLLWPGFGQSNPDSQLSTGFTRSEYELSQFIPLIVLFGVGLLFYYLGAPTRAHIAHVTGSSDTLAPELVQPAPVK
jgi:glutamate:GABA antiporter